MKTAFLHGDLEEKIYMQQSKSYEVPGKENHVWLLKRSLYGLKQSPRQWYSRFVSFVAGKGFSQSNYDSCVYSKKLPDGTPMYLLLYVDDMLVVGSNMEEIKEVKSQLSSEFKMKDLGAAKRTPGMEITRDRPNGKLSLSRRKFTEKILSRFNMEMKKSKSTTLANKFILSRQLSPMTEKEKD